MMSLYVMWQSIFKAVSLTELYESQVASQSFIPALKRAPQKTPAWEAWSQVARQKKLALAP